MDDWCKTLRTNIEELNAALPDYAVEYIISNDGSTRLQRAGLPELTALSNVIFIESVYNEGKGAAIRNGAKASQGIYIIYTDIDFPFGIAPIVTMVKLFSNNLDCGFIYGKRNGTYFRKLPFKRKIVSKVLQFSNRLFLSRYVTDTQAGIKGFRREILPEILSTKTNTFVFEIELIKKLLKRKIQMYSIEVQAKSSIEFTDFSSKILWREAVSLARILIFSNLWNDIL